MKNTQRVWILYIIMFFLNCLNAEEGTTAAKTYLFINAAEFIQDRYFEKYLDFKRYIPLEKRFAFVSTENKKL